MDFYELYNIESETERVNRTYDVFDEAKRLSTKAGKVEFITTVRMPKVITTASMTAFMIC